MTKIFRGANPHNLEGCQTKGFFCQTFLSDIFMDLSDNCRTFRGFCRTLLSDKLGVLSDRFQMLVIVRRVIFVQTKLDLYIVASRLNMMHSSEKKDKGRFSKSNLSDIVRHFYSYSLPILFSSSCYYYYYCHYYHLYNLYNLYN